VPVALTSTAEALHSYHPLSSSEVHSKQVVSLVVEGNPSPEVVMMMMMDDE